jgi:hypothetical protein
MRADATDAQLAERARLINTMFSNFNAGAVIVARELAAAILAAEREKLREK